MWRGALYLFLTFPIFVGGCSRYSQEQMTRWRQTSPVCYNKADCDAKWSAARDWIQRNSAYTFRIYSDTLMETYNSEPYSPKIAVIVNKNPVFVDKGGEQIYQIGVKIGCNNALGCVPSTDEAIMAFNNYVAKVKLNDENCYVKLLKEDPKKPKFGFFSAFIDGKHIVKKVCEKSPAEMAGIQVNDIIVKISDTFMDSQNAFRDYVAKFGEKTTIEIDRNNYQLKANLEFPSEEEVTKLVAKSEFKKTEISQVQTTEEKIESLNRMFEKGLINKDEFNAKKKDLIDKM